MKAKKKSTQPVDTKPLSKPAPTSWSPTIYSRHPSHGAFRSRKVGEKTVFPLGKFPFKVDIGFGSPTQSEAGVLRLNTPEAVENSSHKLRTKELLVKNNIPTPAYATGGQMGEFIKNDSNFPCVFKRISGSGGEGMVVCKTRDEAVAFLQKKQSGYFVEKIFQPNLKQCREYRIHVSPWLAGVEVRFSLARPVDDEGNPQMDLEHYSLRGEIFSMRKKMTKEATEAGHFGRNLNLGHAFFSTNFSKTEVKDKKRGVTVQMDWDFMVDDCVRAVESLGLDFGAVDILWDSETGTHTILEVNSAPSMGAELMQVRTATAVPKEHPLYTFHAYQVALPLVVKAKQDYIKFRKEAQGKFFPK